MQQDTYPTVPFEPWHCINKVISGDLYIEKDFSLLNTILKKPRIIDCYRERIQLIIWITHPSVSVRMVYREAARVSWNCQIAQKIILNYRRDLICSSFHESAFFKGEGGEKLLCNPGILRSLYHPLFGPGLSIMLSLDFIYSFPLCFLINLLFSLASHVISQS